jgi:hypothetical protein
LVVSIALRKAATCPSLAFCAAFEPRIPEMSDAAAPIAGKANAAMRSFPFGVVYARVRGRVPIAPISASSVERSAVMRIVWLNERR